MTERYDVVSDEALEYEQALARVTAQRDALLAALDEATGDMVNAASVLMYEGCEVTRERLMQRVAAIRDLQHRIAIAAAEKGDAS